MNLKPKREITHGDLGIVLGVLVLCKDGIRLCNDTLEPLREGDFVRVSGRRAKMASGLQEVKAGNRTSEETFALAQSLLARQKKFHDSLPVVERKGAAAYRRHHETKS